MYITYHGDNSWNGNAISFLEQEGDKPDSLLICIHGRETAPGRGDGKTVRIARENLLRMDRMLEAGQPKTKEGDE